MKVRAKELGFYNHKRRRAGDVFDVVDERAFSKRWMEKVDGAEPRPKPEVKKREEVQAQVSSEEVI